jgi:hypothetical protein
MVDKIVIDKFKKITNYPIDEFLVESRNFFSKDYVQLVSFFSGKSSFIDKKSIKNLNRLSEQSLIISHVFHYKKNQMKTVDYWELLDSFEDIKTKLETTLNLSKYLRSSIIANKNKAGFVFEHNLTNEQTLEDISRNMLNENSYEDTWVNIAVENDLKEIDYDIKGGNKLKLRKNLFQSTLVTSMIDNTIGEKIYGKDIKKIFTYKDNDLETLGYKETVYQTAEILSQIEKGDIPEFPELGINSSFYKGVNMSQLNFPSIVRELKRNFKTDDLFENFEIKNFKIQDGDIHIEYKVDTKYDLVIIKNVTI